MINTLNHWKTNQYERYKNNLCIEYIYEENNNFIIIFDDKMTEVNYKVYKKDIFTIEDVILTILEISNIYYIHSRINKSIYKELFRKLDHYIR